MDLLEFILRESGRRVQKSFSGYVQLDECPFCQGHGCFTVQTGDDRYFKCFQCEAKGDIFSFAQAFRKLSSPLEALRQIADERGIELEKKAESPPAPDPLKIRRREIFEKAIVHFQETLFSEVGELALRYLTEERGHTLETIRRNGLGLTDGRLFATLTATIPDHDLIQSGLVIAGEDGRTFDAFPAGLIVFPHWITGPEGRFIGDFTLKPYEPERTPLRLRSDYRDPSCLFLNQPAVRERSFIVVEGQHDLLSITGKAGFPNVLATCGQLSNDQIEYLAKVAPGKTIYLAFDNDDSGRRYAEKLRERLSGDLIPPVLQKLVFVKGLDVRQLRWPSTAKDIDEYLASVPKPKEALEKLLEDAAPLYAPLGYCLELFKEQCAEEKRNFYGPEAAKDQADIIFEWLRSDGRFFVQRGAEHKTYVSFRGHVFEIGDDPRFKTLLFELARLVYAEGRTKVIMEVIEYQCRLKGRRIEVSPWLHVEGESEIYLHPGRTDDLILRIADGQVQTVPNAVSCLLRPSNKMSPIEFDPDVNIQRAFADFYHLFISNLSTTPESRYFVACWCLNIFLLGFSRDRALLLCSGDTASGKTTAANLCSMLIYGEDWVGKSKTASDYADGMVNPLLIKDNLEHRDMDRSVQQFLLSAATGTVNQKRERGTDSGNVYERLYNQVLITAIEPFELPELNNRTWNIDFDGKHKNPGFQKSLAMEKLKETRSAILSAFFLVIAREILPCWSERKRFYLNFIRQLFPAHSKHRLDEYLAGLFVILENILRYVPDERRRKLPVDKMARELIEEMFATQESKARETEVHTNTILFLLDQLKSELLYAESPDEFRRSYKLRFDLDLDGRGRPRSVRFRGPALSFHGAFTYLAKQRGFHNPFSTAQQMGSRVKDSREVLERAGWKIETRMVSGAKHYHFSRSLEGENE